MVDIPGLRVLKLTVTVLSTPRSRRRQEGRTTMRRLTFRPALTIKGRKYKGLRGWAGKPFHPPLTDVPVTAYLFVAAFDVLSVALHSSHEVVGRQLYVAGTWTLLGGAAVSLLTALTGWADWHRSSQPGTQARRTINAHALTMIVVTVLVLVDLAIRGLGQQDRLYTSPGVMVLSVIAALLVSIGATLGGSLVYDYGFNVETAGDHPVWHKSEIDVMSGLNAPAPASSAPVAPAVVEKKRETGHQSTLMTFPASTVITADGELPDVRHLRTLTTRRF